MTTVTSNPASPDARSRLSIADWIALILMIVGAINWGLVGTINVDLVAALFGDRTMAARIVYGLVGLSGLWGLTMPMRLRSRA
jgi:uncharacterized membrane protein YuzA (DUF378 family)